ncbi:hypothetical protein RH915_07975 [Serpentinicella sp. ANB-PHB4]|uniref:hypothetical protein n=1 Tax=Serpentinicella sp. ANB-PHB4 TaxID=3074076 RepID=UPI002858A2EC|nr:hypothetical protein [Serpentinicella sp. ANB-PHB4]MDR5659426.1 hypothetical protein [Serpentinicella sp. ANB-PHB4]
MKDLDQMPLEIKKAYAKILSITLSVKGSIEQSKLINFYRLLANIKLNISDRYSLFPLHANNPKDLEALCREVVEGLSDQEINIVRFSLMKDMLIIMNVSDDPSYEEEAVFHSVRKNLNVPEEYVVYFKDEIENDQSFPEMVAEKEALSEVVKKEGIKVAALTAPYFCHKLVVNSKFNKKYKKSTFLSLSEIMYNKRRGRSKKMKKFLIPMALGAASYSVTKTLIEARKRKAEHLKKLTSNKALELQNRAINYLEQDIKTLTDPSMLQSDENPGVEEKIILIRKAVAQLKTSKPKLL